MLSVAFKIFFKDRVMNRKHKGMWRETGKLGMYFFVVLLRQMKATCPPADKGAASCAYLTHNVINRTRIILANWCLTLKLRYWFRGRCTSVEYKNHFLPECSLFQMVQYFTDRYINEVVHSDGLDFCRIASSCIITATFIYSFCILVFY